jgi:hypothetical protein
MHHYAVIGRIPFDDEDSIYLFKSLEPMASTQLVELFIAHIYVDAGRTPPGLEEPEEPVVLNAILTSMAPIELKLFHV